MTTPDEVPSSLTAEWNELDDVMVLSDAAVITWVSGAITTMLGYDRDEVVGTLVPDLVHPDDRAGYGAVRMLLHTVGVAHLRCRVRHRSGAWRWVDARLTVLPVDRTEPASSRVLGFWRDVTDEVDATGARRAAEPAADHVDARLGSDGTITWVAPAVTERFGYAPAALVGLPLTALLHPVDRRRAFAADRAAASEPPTFAVRLLAADGRWITTTIELSRHADDPRADLAMCWRVADAPAPAPDPDTAGRLVLVEHAPDVLVHERDGRIVSVSPSVTASFGWSPAELLGRPLADLVRADDAPARADGSPRTGTWRARHRVLASDGTWHWVESHAAVVRDADGVDLGVVESWRVIDDQVAIERELTMRATHDGLTGLLNRSTVLDRLGHLLHERQDDGVVVALVYIDVDDFKGVNDRHGHAVGDEILVRLARTVRSVVRQDDLVGRLGGDELLVVLRGVSDLGVAANVAIKVLAAARSVARTPQGATLPTLSVGVTLARPPEAVADALARADRAMYQAKRAGGDHVVTRAEST